MVQNFSQKQREEILSGILEALGHPAWCKSVGVGMDYMAPCIFVHVTEEGHEAEIPSSFKGIQVKVYIVSDSDDGMMA